MATPFSPTHIIKLDRGDAIYVLLDDGVAYQQCEWDTCDVADYERTDDGRWLFQGQPFNGRVFEMTDADRTQWLYRAAEARVSGDERLAPHRETILDDHGDGDDHWRWVIDSEVDEIIDWVKAHV